MNEVISATYRDDIRECSHITPSKFELEMTPSSPFIKISHQYVTPMNFSGSNSGIKCFASL